MCHHSQAPLRYFNSIKWRLLMWLFPRYKNPFAMEIKTVVSFLAYSLLSILHKSDIKKLRNKMHRPYVMWSKKVIFFNKSSIQNNFLQHCYIVHSLKTWWSNVKSHTFVIMQWTRCRNHRGIQRNTQILIYDCRRRLCGTTWFHQCSFVL